MRSKAALDMPADSGVSGVGASIGAYLRGGLFWLSRANLIDRKRAAIQSRWGSPGRAVGVGSRPQSRTPQDRHMTQFNDTELTAAVIESFDETPEPRTKFLLQELVKSLHEYVRKTDLTFDEWPPGSEFPPRPGNN